MEKSLREAAEKGKVDSLLQLLKQDAQLLDRFIAGSYTETPLHLASMHGHPKFVQEILTRKPELAKELDSRKASPLHLATAGGHVEIVNSLLKANPDMCSQCDQDGRNPLHIAVIEGQVNILRDLVHARPHAAQALMDGGDTILHACVRHKQLEAMKFLVEAIRDPSFLNYENDDGNTVLHLAVADRQHEAVNLLLATHRSESTIEVNSTNADGLRALDILSQKKKDVKDEEIAKSLRSAGAVRARGNPLPRHELNNIRKQILWSPSSNQKNPFGRKKCRNTFFNKFFSNSDADWLQNQRKSLMVVASLNATMAFQAALTSPGGNFSAPRSTPFPAKPPAIHDPSRNFLVKLYHFIDSRKRYDFLFLGFNTASFLASLSIILLLISGLPLRQRFFMWILMVIMWIAVTALAMAYLMIISSYYYPAATEDDRVRKVATFLVLGLVWIGLMLLLLLGHAIRLIVKMIRYLINLTTPKPGPSKSSIV